MKHATFALLALLVLPLSASAAEPAKPGNPQVRLTTSHGVIELQLDAQKAPKTVANFMRYVNSGFYNDTIFHRVIPGFMIQGGGMARGMKEKPTNEKIPNEADNGLKNLTGTISMARTSDPHSASAQFFINTADNTLLNHRGKDPAGWGYAVFGRVTKGMDVVRAIEAAPTGNVGVHQNVPLSDIVITKAETFKGPSFEQAGSASAVKPKTSGASNAGSGEKWPAGVEPGNLYLIHYIHLLRHPAGASSNDHIEDKLIVAAKTGAEAVALIERLWDKWKKEDRHRQEATTSLKVNILGECTGPNWGAVIHHTSNTKSTTVVACGAKTPREAILGAAKKCASEAGRSCTADEANLYISIGHSGAKPWTTPFSINYTGFPHKDMYFTALGASTVQHGYKNFPKSPEEAVSLLGKTCREYGASRDTHSCWVTFNNVGCILNVNPSDGRENQQKCVDTKLTADGYFP